MGSILVLPKYVEIIINPIKNNNFHPRQKQTASVKKTEEKLKNALRTPFRASL